MRSIDDYIDIAKRKQGFSSDNELAKFLGISGPSLNGWRSRRSWPSDAVMLKLVAAAGDSNPASIEARQARGLVELNIWRAKSPAVRDQYEHLLSRITAIASALALFLLTFAPAPSEAAQRDMARDQHNYGK